jgi:HPt (histidine-containing phosphotransfer) domain-containing protein
MSRTDVDPTALQRLDRLGGPEFVVRIIDIFLAESPRKLAATREALAAGDGAGVAYAAHSLVSSAANLGAGELCELARRVERDATGGRLDAIPPLLAELSAVYDRVHTHLQAEHERWRER